MVAPASAPAPSESDYLLCEDCAGEPAAYGIFDGGRIVQTCGTCALSRCMEPVPAFSLPGDGWIIGHASQVLTPIMHGLKTPRVERFRRGAFRNCATNRTVVLGMNHHACACKKPGRSRHTEEADALIEWTGVLAATRQQNPPWIGPMLLDEDAYGLLVIAQIHPGATWQHEWCSRAGCQHGPVPVHDAIASGRCSGMSIHFHGGNRMVGPAIPLDAVDFTHVNLQEISLIVEEDGTRPDMPGTWVQPAGPAAMTELYTRLRLGVAKVDEWRG